MPDILIVARKEMLDILSHKLTVILTLGISVYVGVFAPLRFLEAQRAWLGSLQPTLDIYLSFFFLATALIVSWGLTSIPFMLEKTRRTFETLLTTPLSLGTIWLGKTLAVFVLCYPLALIYALALILYMNITTEANHLILPSQVGWWIMLVLAPLSVYGIIALNGLVQMILMQPRVGQFVTFGVIFIVYRTGARFLSQPGILLIGGYLLGILVLLLLIVGSLRFLTKERIVLSIG